MHKLLALVNRGVMNIKPARPLHVTLAKFQEIPVHIQNNMNVTIAAEALTAMWDPNSGRK